MAGAPPPTNHLRGEDAREVRSPVIPEDGYEWKKYGHKFIQNKRRYRSYFRCRDKRCKAKKKVEWPPSDLSSIKISYDGVHDHASPQPRSNLEKEALARMANRYNLANQVFGSPSDSSQNPAFNFKPLVSLSHGL